MNECSFMQPADKRDVILDAALRMFVERTFAGCAVPLVADAAGVATGTIYRYFPSKEALVNAVYQHWKGELRRRLVTESNGAEAESAREEFHRWWAALSAFVDEQPEAFEFLEMHHHEPYLDADSKALALEVDVAAMQLAQRGQATGEIRDLPAALLVALVFGAFTGVVRARRLYGALFDHTALAVAEDAAWDLVRNPSPPTVTLAGRPAAATAKDAAPRSRVSPDRPSPEPAHTRATRKKVAR